MKIEPTEEQLQQALARLRAAAPRIWPEHLVDLPPLQTQLVRARALQAIHAADLRSREQVPVVCSRPDGGRFTHWVYGQPTDQLALGEDFT